MKHLVKSMHDVVNRPTEIWCNAQWGRMDTTEDVSESDCGACLKAVRNLGQQAESRLRQLRHRAGGCPILNHAEDCTCDGSMGDR